MFLDFIQTFLVVQICFLNSLGMGLNIKFCNVILETNTVSPKSRHPTPDCSARVYIVVSPQMFPHPLKYVSLFIQKRWNAFQNISQNISKYRNITSVNTQIISKASTTDQPNNRILGTLPTASERSQVGPNHSKRNGRSS